MARIAKPWFYRQSGWWMAYVNGQKTKLAYGRENRQAAKDKLLQLLLVASANVSPEEPDQTVASVIDQYLTHAADLLAQSTRQMRLPYLQSFSEMHGWRKVAECRPSHMREWVKAHPEWESDWTKNGAIRNVQVAFNWAAGPERLIKENPFRGVTHHTGEPRRPLCPIASGIVESTKVADPTHWTPLFKKSQGLSATLKLAPSLFARQFYLESLLLRS